MGGGREEAPLWAFEVFNAEGVFTTKLKHEIEGLRSLFDEARGMGVNIRKATLESIVFPDGIDESTTGFTSAAALDQWIHEHLELKPSGVLPRERCFQVLIVALTMFDPDFDPDFVNFRSCPPAHSVPAADFGWLTPRSREDILTGLAVTRQDKGAGAVKQIHSMLNGALKRLISTSSMLSSSAVAQRGRLSDGTSPTEKSATLVGGSTAPKLRSEDADEMRLSDMVWKLLDRRVLDSNELAMRKNLNTTPASIRQIIVAIRRERGKDSLIHRRGFGYFRPDAPPVWRDCEVKRAPRMRPR
jgi:hypothetical protein